LHETGDDFEFSLASNKDLFAIKKQGGGTNTTEIHVLSAASNYQQFSLHTGTALHLTDKSWTFAVAANRDVIGIKKNGGASNSTEIHVLSAASGYTQFSLHTATALHVTDENWAFVIASNRDVFGIKKQGGASKTTEIHVLSAANGYTEFSLHTLTSLHQTDGSWAFAIATNRDLFCINKMGDGNLSTKPQELPSTEVHVLSAGDNYRSFDIEKGTALHPTPLNWEFAVTSERNLFGIKKQHTGSNSTEIHIVDFYSVTSEASTSRLKTSPD
jgi:hypothetical protein